MEVIENTEVLEDSGLQARPPFFNNLPIRWDELGSGARLWRIQAFAENGGRAVGVGEVGVRSKAEPLLFPACRRWGTVWFSVSGVVNLPEFPARAAELNSNHITAQSLPADERYAASLMFLGG
jgi:hypothetical protein